MGATLSRMGAEAMKDMTTEQKKIFEDALAATEPK